MMEDFTSRRLSLHQTTARDATPAEIVRTAAALGCPHVCLFTQLPFPNSPFPVVADQEVDELARLMDGLGVSILSTTSFTLTPDVEIADFAGGLGRAAGLGGTIANVRIRDDDLTRTIDNFGRFGDLARSHGIEATIEFMGFDVPHILDQTLEVIRQAGCGKLTIDPLHVIRTGTPIAALLQLDRELIGYVQLCDGLLGATREHYADEGPYNRLPPGMGGFPLIELLHATPEGAPLALEVPQEQLLRRGVSVMDRARRAIDGARRLLEEASSGADGQLG